MTMIDPALGEGADTGAVQRLYADLETHDVEALWRINEQIMPFAPRPRTRAWLWRYRTLIGLAARAGELVPIDRGGDRRVLACVNPGLKEAYGGAVHGATHSLWAAIQYLAPGESAPGHRHSPSALRFVVSGSGAWTTVDGERCFMSPGDLVVTPAWSWHDHENTSSEPMVWFDGLDLPLAAYLEAQFLEFPDGDAIQRVLDTHASERAFSAPGLSPLEVPPVVSGAGRGELPEGLTLQPRTPILRYPYERTKGALEGLRADAAHPVEGVLLRYDDPRTGGSIMPTLDAAIQLLPDGFEGRPHRHVSSAVYQVFSGSGYTVIERTRFDWEEGDIFAVPPWAVHSHHTPMGDAVVFSISDAPVLRKLGLERIVDAAAPQPVQQVFEPTR